MFSSVYVKVNAGNLKATPFDVEEKNLNFGYIQYKHHNFSNAEISIEYAENLISKKVSGVRKFEELPKNLQTLRNVSFELASKLNEDGLEYHYNEFKGTLRIYYTSNSFGYSDQIILWISNPEILDTKKQLVDLNSPNNQLITDLMEKLKNEYEIFKKVNSDNDIRMTFKFYHAFPGCELKICLYNYKQVGDMRIQNLIDNRLFSKYFIIDPLK